MDLRQLLVGRSVGRSLIRGLAMALLLVLGSRFVLVPVRAHGPSMTPTYGDGQLLLVDRLAYRFGRAVRRGDVVAITLRGGQAVLVKRIIALPGERIRIENGQVLIDDAPLDEPYCVYRLPWNVQESQLGPDEVFVIGDNRSMLEKYHDFGRADRGRILGRMINCCGGPSSPPRRARWRSPPSCPGRPTRGPSASASRQRRTRSPYRPAKATCSGWPGPPACGTASPPT
jgi:signal peptidase I